MPKFNLMENESIRPSYYFQTNHPGNVLMLKHHWNGYVLEEYYAF
jgi:hypothetical protein